MLDLQPMPESDFKQFYQVFAAQYVQAMLKSGEFANYPTASKHAQSDLDLFLGQGYHSPYQLFYHLFLPQSLSNHNTKSSTPDNIGFIWYSEQLPGNPNLAWLCYIYIKPQYRGQGFAKYAIIECEKKIKARGVNAIGLNVYAFNETAKRLYQDLGYSIKYTFPTHNQQAVCRYEMVKYFTGTQV